MNGRITDLYTIRTFVLAGHATFTLKSIKTGTRFTYKVSAPNEQNANKPIWFVSLLSGPDNEVDYQYFGNLRPAFEIGCKSRISVGAKSVKAFSWFWSNIDCPELLKHVEFWHEGRCGRCGRKLTVPESVESGFGPECITKI